MTPGPRRRVADPALVDAAQRGDDTAFEELVRRHSDLVYGVAMRLLRDPHDAEDAAQAAFVRAWRSLDDFRTDARFTTWLYRIVTNTCIDHLRVHAGRTTTLPPFIADDDAGPADRAVAASVADVVEVAIATLAPGDRAAFLLRTMEQLSYAEVAAVLDISTSAVRSRLRRSRRTIADALDDSESSPTGFGPTEPEPTEFDPTGLDQEQTDA